jgi:hypothetical protein
MNRGTFLLFPLLGLTLAGCPKSATPNKTAKETLKVGFLPVT